VTYGVTIVPTTAAKSGDPGSVVTYLLTVTNTGNAADSFTVTVSAGSMFANSVTPATINNLAASASAPVTVTVSIPAGAAGGYSEAATVTVVSQGDPSQQATSTLTTTVNTVRGVVINPTADAQIGQRGGTVTYTLMVTNTGNATDSFTVTVSPGVTFTNNVLPLFIINLASNASTLVTVTVSIPSNLLGFSATDTAIITVQSIGDLTKTAVATLTTTADLTRKVYLPIVIR
jgi:uncharacterized repeat protein (TIGR01451 family)